MLFFQQPLGPSQYSRDYFSSQQQDSPAGFSSSASLLADQVLSSRQNEDEYGGRYQTRRPPEPDYGESRYGSGGGRGYRRSPSPPMQRDRYLYQRSMKKALFKMMPVHVESTRGLWIHRRIHVVFVDSNGLVISGGEGATTRTSTP